MHSYVKLGYRLHNSFDSEPVAKQILPQVDTPSLYSEYYVHMPLSNKGSSLNQKTNVG